MDKDLRGCFLTHTVVMFFVRYFLNEWLLCAASANRPNIPGEGRRAVKAVSSMVNRQAGRRLNLRAAAPSPNFVAMATRVGPQHSSRFHWIGHPRKPPGMPKHLQSICHTSRLIGDFVQNLGSKFWALGGTEWNPGTRVPENPGNPSFFKPVNPVCEWSKTRVWRV